MCIHLHRQHNTEIWQNFQLTKLLVTMTAWILRKQFSCSCCNAVCCMLPMLLLQKYGKWWCNGCISSYLQFCCWITWQHTKATPTADRILCATTVATHFAVECLGVANMYFPFVCMCMCCGCVCECKYASFCTCVCVCILACKCAGVLCQCVVHFNIFPSSFITLFVSVAYVMQCHL